MSSATDSDDIDLLNARVRAQRAALGDTLGALAAKADVSTRAKAKAVEVRDNAVRAVGRRPGRAVVGTVAVLLTVAALMVLAARRRR
jgi:hypothetical protein